MINHKLLIFSFYNPSVYGELEVPFPSVILTSGFRYRTGRTAYW